MTASAITARLLVFMRDLSPEKAAEFCELVREIIESSMTADKLVEVKGMELIGQILKIAAEHQRQQIAEKGDACRGCGKPANHTAGGLRWCSSRCELAWLRGHA